MLSESYIYTIQGDMHGYTIAIPLCMSIASYTKHIIGIHIVYGIYHNGKRVICPLVSFPTRISMVYKRIPYIPNVILSYTCMLECYTTV